MDISYAQHSDRQSLECPTFDFDWTTPELEQYLSDPNHNLSWTSTAWSPAQGQSSSVAKTTTATPALYSEPKSCDFPMAGRLPDDLNVATVVDTVSMNNAKPQLAQRSAAGPTRRRGSQTRQKVSVTLPTISLSMV